MSDDLMSVPAASVKTGDRVWFMGQLHGVTRVENHTPRDGMVTWSLEEWSAPVPVPATKRVSIKRA
jgi:hypothetical protein